MILLLHVADAYPMSLVLFTCVLRFRLKMTENIVLYTLHYGIVSNYTVLYYTVVYCIIPYYTVLYCIILPYTVLYHTILYYMIWQYIVLYRIIQYYIAVNCLASVAVEYRKEDIVME